MKRIVRRGFTPDFIRMRAASSVVATARSVVGRTGGAVPRVDVAADDHVFVGQLGPGDVGDDVVELDRPLLEIIADVEFQRDRLAFLEQAGELVELLAEQGDRREASGVCPR